jgi:hypothetical protein
LQFFSLASLLEVLAKLSLPTIELLRGVGCEVSDGRGAIGRDGGAERPHQGGGCRADQARTQHGGVVLEEKDGDGLRSGRRKAGDSLEYEGKMQK